MPLTPIWILNDTFTAANGTLLIAHTSDDGATYTRLDGWGVDEDAAMRIHSNAARRTTYAENPIVSGGECLFSPSVAIPDDSGGFVLEADLVRNNTVGGVAFEVYKGVNPGNKDIICWIGANGQPCFGYTDPSVGSVLTGTHLLRYETDFTTVTVSLDGGVLFTENWFQPTTNPSNGRNGPVVGTLNFGLYDSGEAAGLSILGLRMGYVSAVESAFWQDFTKSREIVPV
jgi:hypothetical protein